MQEEINPQQNPGQFFQEVKKEGPVHPVVAVLMEQEKRIKGLVNTVAGGKLLVEEEERAKADSEILASDQFKTVVKGIINMPVFNLGEIDIVNIGKYLDANFPRTDPGKVKGITNATIFRKHLARAIGIIYSIRGIKGISNEMLENYVWINPRDVINKSPEIAGNKEALEQITGRTSPVVKLINKWDGKKDDIKKKYGVSERFFTITGDIGNGFSQIDLFASIALSKLPPIAPNQTATK